MTDFFFPPGDRSSTGRPDWTCIVVGFTSGYVRFYTEVSSSLAVRRRQSLGPRLTQPRHAHSGLVTCCLGTSG